MFVRIKDSIINIDKLNYINITNKNDNQVDMFYNLNCNEQLNYITLDENQYEDFICYISIHNINKCVYYEFGKYVINMSRVIDLSLSRNSTGYNITFDDGKNIYIDFCDFISDADKNINVIHEYLSGIFNIYRI